MSAETEATYRRAETAHRAAIAAIDAEFHRALVPLQEETGRALGRLRGDYPEGNETPGIGPGNSQWNESLGCGPARQWIDESYERARNATIERFRPRWAAEYARWSAWQAGWRG